MHKRGPTCLVRRDFGAQLGDPWYDNVNIVALLTEPIVALKYLPG